MGGSDFHCSVSGACHFSSRETFRDAIFWQCDLRVAESSSAEEDDAPKDKLAVSEAVSEGLRYSEEDVDSSPTFVAICPYDTDEDGQVVVNTETLNEYDGPEEYDESTLIEVFNVIPGHSPPLGDYVNKYPEDPNAYGGEYLVASFGYSLIIAYTSYLILKQAAPRVTPYALYALAYGDMGVDQGTIFGVDYGTVDMTVMPDLIDWAGICGLDWHGRRDFWEELLTQEDKTADEILHEAWRGPGNMWVFVRPDRFPVAETLAAEPLPTFFFDDLEQGAASFESLPLDILLVICVEIPMRTTYALLSTCKRVRAILLPHADSIVRQKLREDEPWYLPAGPFDLPDKRHGYEEVDWWNAQWAAGGISGEDVNMKIPWFLYRKQCSNSMSMWNRERIWGVAEQLEELAQVNNLL